MNKFLSSNATGYRLARTILQGIIGVVIANLDAIFSCLDFSAEMKVLIMGITMAVLSPVMGAISTNGEVIEAYGGESQGNSELEHELNDPGDADDEDEEV